METWDDSESLEDDFKEERANTTLKASTEEFESESNSESDLDSDEVFSHLTRSELESSLYEILQKSQKLQ